MTCNVVFEIYEILTCRMLTISTVDILNSVIQFSFHLYCVCLIFSGSDGLTRDYFIAKNKILKRKLEVNTIRFVGIANNCNLSLGLL